MANPVAKPTMVFVGGRGTKAGNDNATGCTVASFSGKLSDYMGTNGDLLVDNATASATQSDTTLYPSGKVKLTFTGTGARVGMLIRCTGGTYYAGIYEILEVGVGNSFVIIDVTYRGDDTVYVYMGGAFQGIQQALDDDITLREASDAKYYSRYICTNKDETLAATVTVSAETANYLAASYNAWLGIIGFKTSLTLAANGIDIISDCDMGQEYYQGAWSSFRRDKSYTDHNPNGHLVYWNFNGNTVHCFLLNAYTTFYRNLKIGNNGGSYYFVDNAVASANHVWENCWLYNIYDTCYYTGNGIAYPFFQNVYVGPIRRASSEGWNRFSITANHCIFATNCTEPNMAFRLFNCMVWGCSYYRVFGGSIISNCIFYNQSAACLYCVSSQYYTQIQNCIFSPLSKTAEVAMSNSTTSFSALYRNFFKNCIAYSVNGDSVLDDIALINGTLALPEPMSCLEVNPKFVNPAAGDFRLQPDSPALNAGYRDLFGGFQSIGPYDMRASNLSKGHK